MPTANQSAFKNKEGASKQSSSAYAPMPGLIKALTLLPLDANHELDMAIDGVISQDTGCAALGACKPDLGVDVEREGLAARRPDGGGERDIVGDGVVGRDRPGERGLRGHLVWLAGEVVGCLLDTGDASVEADVATELRAEDAVLEAGWILKIQVQLAVLAGLCCGDAGAYGGNVGVED